GFLLASTYPGLIIHWETWAGWPPFSRDSSVNGNRHRTFGPSNLAACGPRGGTYGRSVVFCLGTTQVWPVHRSGIERVGRQRPTAPRRHRLERRGGNRGTGQPRQEFISDS